MPFIAKDKETGERVDITTIDNPRQKLTSSSIVCQLCGEPMIIRAGLIIRAHFAHIRKCSSDYQSHPESREHRETKVFLAQKLSELYSSYTTVEPMLEVPIPEIKRVADILFTFPMGWRIAHEVQLSPITVEKLEERTNDYLSAGIDVFWWLGKSADTPANRQWCTDFLGHTYRISYDESGVTWKPITGGVLSPSGIRVQFISQLPDTDIKFLYHEGDFIHDFKSLAFLRFVEVWHFIESKSFRRGVLATRRLLSSICGKIGNNNLNLGHNRGFLQKQVKNTKKSGEQACPYWRFRPNQYFYNKLEYRKIRPLSSKAIETVKHNAFVYNARG